MMQRYSYFVMSRLARGYLAKQKGSRRWFAILFSVVIVLFLIIMRGVIDWAFGAGFSAQHYSTSLLSGVVILPFLFYFFRLVIDMLETSSEQLSASLQALKDLREKDLLLNYELKQKSEFLSSFFKATPDIIYYLAPSGEILACNERLAQAFHKESREDLIGQNFKALLAKEEQACTVAMIDEVVRTHRKITYEYWRTSKEGEKTCLLSTKIPYFDEERGEWCVMGFERDITEFRRNQHIIEQQIAEKSQLIHQISHELRTPLNGIVGLSRMLLERENDPTKRDYLSSINISANTLGYIFSDLMDFSKIESNQFKLYVQPVELSKLISNIAVLANLMTAQKKQQFFCDYDKNLSTYIDIDEARLNQVLWNLLSNSVKFTPENGQIYFSVVRTDSHSYCFKIRDTGIGIAEADQAKIFDMYYQVKHKDNKYALGSGIGLAVSKQLVEKMGGSLCVESTPNQGATFSVCLPIKEAAALPQLALPHYGLNVLLVEDIQLNVLVATAMLEKFGCQVDVAMSGKAAREKFAEKSYDLVLLDIRLPDASGFELSQQWRTQYEAEEIDVLPILIALSANVVRSENQYAEFGMDDALAKPLSLSDLACCLARHFGEEVDVEQCCKVEKTAENARPNALERTQTASLPRLDEAVLRELVSLLGKATAQENLALLRRVMPDYLAELQHAYAAYQANDTAQTRQAVMDIAHKIKGAVAIVGLMRLQEIAKLAQNDSAQWQAQIDGWINELNTQWDADLRLADDFLQTFEE